MNFLKKAIFSVVALSVTSLAQAQGSNPLRLIVVSDQPDAVEQDLHAQGGNLIRKLRYIHGFVANGNRGLMQALQKKYPKALIEIDHKASFIDKEVSAESVKKGGSGGSTQPAQVLPWGISAVQADQAWASSRGAGAKVCVLDTGIQADHPDLAANVLGGQNFVITHGPLKPDAWADDNGHGTHVSGTIAALDNSIGVVGVAPEAKLFAAKVLDSSGNGWLSDVADGIRYCMTTGAQVMNMSLGGTDNVTVLEQAVQDAVAAGYVLVAAAGNSARAVSYPARYPGVVAVTAVDSQLNFATFFSNYGPEVSFTAPGVDVNSTYIGSGYKLMTGTSMASPHVAGTAALMISAQSLGLVGRDIGLTPEQEGQGLIDALSTVLNK